MDPRKLYHTQIGKEPDLIFFPKDFLETFKNEDMWGKPPEKNVTILNLGEEFQPTEQEEGMLELLDSLNERGVELIQLT